MTHHFVLKHQTWLWLLCILFSSAPNAQAQDKRVALVDSVRLHNYDSYNGSLDYFNPYLMAGEQVIIESRETHPWTDEEWLEVKLEADNSSTNWARAKFFASPEEDVQAARQELQQAEQQRYEKARNILQIESATTSVNSACGVDLRISFKNTSSRKVKYAYFTTEFYNAVDDRVRDDITDDVRKNLQVTGPIQPDQSQAQTYYWENVFWDCAVDRPKLTKASFSFIDGPDDGHADEYFFYERLDYARGIQPSFSGSGTAVFDSEQIPTTFTLSPGYPNPFRQKTNLRLQLNMAQSMSIRLYDALGHQVKTLQDSFLSAGEHELTIDASGLPSGLYFVVTTGKKESATRPITLVR